MGTEQKKHYKYLSLSSILLTFLGTGPGADPVTSLGLSDPSSTEGINSAWLWIHHGHSGELWNQLSPKQTDSTGVFYCVFWNDPSYPIETIFATGSYNFIENMPKKNSCFGSDRPSSSIGNTSVFRVKFSTAELSRYSYHKEHFVPKSWKRFQNSSSTFAEDPWKNGCTYLYMNDECVEFWWISCRSSYTIYPWIRHVWKMLRTQRALVPWDCCNFQKIQSRCQLGYSTHLLKNCCPNNRK